MKQSYTIPEARRAEIEKLVTRYQKKATKYGAAMSAEYSKPYAAMVPVRKIDQTSGVIYEVKKILVELFDLTIDGDEIRKHGYTVVAKIEHLEGGNVVSTFGTEIKQGWREASGRCEHCNSDRNRRLTFIVRHEDGNEKQVGRTCLKDYCGIDPQAIGYRNELNEILLDDDIGRYDFEARPVGEAYDTIAALALAIRIIRRQGYVKSGEPNSNKNRIMEGFKEEKPTEAEIQEAEALAKTVDEIDGDEAIKAGLNNVQSLIRSRYCKSSHFGFIAYAPVSCENYLGEKKRRQEREAARIAERRDSEYIGQIGKRIDVTVAEMKLVTSWENQWGYTYLYKFIDTDGNVLVWFASQALERVNENGIYEDMTRVERIRATVKEHNEHDGVKQTIITRCKVV